jgi:hypothetical protein
MRHGGSKAPIYTPQERQQLFAGWLWIARERGNKPGLAAYRFKDKFGHFPPSHWDVTPEPPSAEALAWDRHCRIKYAKSMRKAEAA